MTRYRFGTRPEFELQVDERQLLADGRPVALGSRAMEVLFALVERPGQLVSRRELIERVWPDAAVEENNLNVQVSALRKVLGGQLIATIPGRGYSFTRQPHASPPPPTGLPPARWRTNLPATLTPLIGRDGEQIELDRLVAAHRLVTIIGPGGVGKTLLAQHLLRRHEARFRHGVCFVDLSALRDAADIPGAIASALQIRPGAGGPLRGLADAIAPLAVMVVLDNAEHLLQATAEVVLALHEAAPALHLVVTSQAPLKLAPERLHRIGALAVPEHHLPAEAAMAFGAIALFVDRAQAADSRFVLSDDGAAAAIDLCRALDGLPLAIELAAWRAPTLGVRRLAESMREPLKVLAAPHRGVPLRLQTLRHALAWSHGMLDAREQVVLRRLGTLVGSSDLELIQRVVRDPPSQGPIDEWAVVDALATLVERSLVTVVPDGKSDVRYRMLDTPRAFARERLIQSGEAAMMGRRHAMAVAERFRQAHEEHFSGQVELADWQRRHLPDLDNGFAALAWLREQGDDPAALTLLPGLLLATPREERDKRDATITLIAERVAQAEPGPTTLFALLEAAMIEQARFGERGMALADAAVAMAQACEHRFADRRWTYRAHAVQALALLTRARTDAGAASMARARAIEQPSWPAILRVPRWMSEVFLADRRGDGQAMYQASLRLTQVFREAGLPLWVSGLNQVNGALAGGRADEAVRHGMEVVAQLEGTRHLGELAETRLQLVGALIECGRLDEARRHSQAAWPLVSRFARIDAWADYQSLLAAREGRPEDAALMLGYANGICARDGIVRTHNELAAVERTLSILSTQLDPGTLDHLLARGETLLEQDIGAVAFGDPGDR